MTASLRKNFLPKHTWLLVLGIKFCIALHSAILALGSEGRTFHTKVTSFKIDLARHFNTPPDFSLAWSFAWMRFLSFFSCFNRFSAPFLSGSFWHG